MYAKITYTATTLVNVLNIVTNILTDQVTDVTTLTNVNAGASFINTTYNPSGWVIHDQVDANNVVLKSLVFDSTTRYKYMKLSTANAGYLTMIVYDGWDNVAHAGTYPAVASTASITWFPPIDITNGGVLYINASTRFITVYSIVAGAIKGPYGIAERSRWAPWDTAARSYCNFFQFSCADPAVATATVQFPYDYLSSSSGLVLTAQRPGYYSGVWGAGINSGTTYLLTKSTITRYILDANLNYVYQTYPLYVFTGTSEPGGSVTDVCDIRVAPYSVGSIEDVFTIDSKNYALLKSSYPTNFLYIAG